MLRCLVFVALSIPAADPSPLDALRPENIPPQFRHPWQPKELVAVVNGEALKAWHRWPTLDVEVISDDGKIGGRGLPLRLWDIDACRLFFEHQLPDDKRLQDRFELKRQAVGLDRSGQRIVTAHHGGIVRVWKRDGDAVKESSSFRTAGNAANLVVSLDGSLIFVSSVSHPPEIWKIRGEKPTLLGRMKGFAPWPRGTFRPAGAEFLSSGRGLVMYWEDGVVELASMTTDRVGEQVQIHRFATPVVAVAVSQDERTIAARAGFRSLDQPENPSRSHEVRVWARKDSVFKLKHSIQVPAGREIKGEERPNVAIALSPNGRTLAAAEGIHTQAEGVPPVAGSGTREMIWGRRRVGNIHLWSVGGDKYRSIGVIPVEPHPAPRSFRFEDDSTIAMLTPELHLFRHRIGQPPPPRPPLLDEERYGRGDMCFSPDGSRLYCSGKLNGVVEVWKLSNGTVVLERILKIDPRNPRRWRINLDPSGRRLALAPMDYGVERPFRIWDVAAAEPCELLAFGVSDEDINGIPGEKVALSSDGSTLATIHDECVRLWRYDSTKASELMRIPVVESRNDLPPVCFSPDGKLVAVRVSSKAVGLWRIDGTAITPLKMLDVSTSGLRFDWPLSIEFPKGGDFIAVGFEGAVRQWSLKNFEASAPRRIPERGCHLDYHANAVIRLNGPNAEVWSRDDNRLLTNWNLPRGVRGGFVVAPDFRHLAAGVGGGTIYILRLPATP